MYTIPVFAKNKNGHHFLKETKPAANLSVSLVSNFGWISFSDCLPQTIQFIDSSVASSTNIQQWIWNFGDSTTSADQYPLHDYTSNGNYTVSLTVIDDAGNAATAIKALIVNTLTPVVNIGKDTTVCSGTIVKLDAGAQPGCSYYWNTGETSQSIQVNTTGDYWVQVSNASCAAMAQVHITVNPKLLSDFTYTITGTCLPVLVQFTDQSASCTSPVVSWQWDFGDGNVSGQQNPAHLYAVAGNYTVSLTVKDSAGTSVTSSRLVSINASALLVNIGNDTTICEGSTLTLNPNIAADSYTWSNGSTNPGLTVTTAGTYWVEVFKNGCSGRDTVVINTIMPLVPGISFTISSRCLPVLVHFSDSSQLVCGNAPIDYWRWDLGDGSNSDLQNPDHVYTKAGQFTVQLTVRNSLGIEVTKSSQITIETTAPVPTHYPDTTICAGTTLQLNAGNTGAVYSWMPAAALNNAAIQNPFATPGATTLFRVNITQCGNSITDSVWVYVDSVANAKITQPEQGLLMAAAAVSYQWYKDGAMIKTAAARNYRPVSMGNYQVKITNERGCSRISDKFFFLPSGGHAFPGTKVKIKLSPNPCRGNLSILLSKLPEKPLTAFIYDVFGNKVYQGTISSNINNINVGHLCRGQYMVAIWLGNEEIILPLLIL